MKKYSSIMFILLFFLLFITLHSYANDELVYIDNNEIDTKYHRITCSNIFSNDYHSISVEEAFNMGYRRCLDCFPPMSDVEYNTRLEEAKRLINSINTQSNTYSEKYVYVTESGSKYHEYGCNTIKSTPHKMELETAINKGYAPCKVCNPYGFANAEIAEEKSEQRKITTRIVIIISICILLLVVYIIFNDRKYKTTRKK